MFSVQPKSTLVAAYNETGDIIKGTASATFELLEFSIISHLGFVICDFYLLSIDLHS